MLVMDVDGTLTDGKIYMSAGGELFKAFDIKDGYSIYTLDKHGIIPVIITGRESEIVSNRAKELKIREVHQDVHDKVAKLKEVIDKYNFSLAEVAYIGDDYNDKQCIDICGLTGCPADAEVEISKYVDFVCKSKAGEGAVREFIKHIIEIGRAHV